MRLFEQLLRGPRFKTESRCPIVAITPRQKLPDDRPPIINHHSPRAVYNSSDACSP